MAAPYQPKPYSKEPDENVKCPGCSKINDDDAKYCDQCGMKLAGRTDVVVTPQPPGSSDNEGAFRNMMRR